jgi:hypothetical protein
MVDVVLPTHAQFRDALRKAQRADNGGLGFHMWGTIVNRSGVVVAIAYSGEAEGDQWPASRLISAQKANTANALGLDKFALSTANLYAATQPGGSLFGVQESNPVNIAVAYTGEADRYGSESDPFPVITLASREIRSDRRRWERSRVRGDCAPSTR